MKGMKKLFVITDGKNYVMRNPMYPDKYISSTSSIQAEQFTYKQARALVRTKKAALKWIKSYRIIDVESGKEESSNISNEGVFCGNKDIQLDEKILDDINLETEKILSISGWNMVQLTTYKNTLNGALSKYDSMETDIAHALEKYKETHDGKNPPAHKVSKLGYMILDIREKRRKIKQCISCIEIMQNAITYKYDLSKIKYDLNNVKKSEYKGRTEYYKLALEILE